MKRPVRIAVLFAVLLAACGGRAAMVEHAGQGLSVTLNAVNAARDQFMSWDEVHQKDILAANSTRESFDAAIKAYRVKQAKVLQAFTIAYNVIGTTSAALPLVEADKMSWSDVVVDLLQVADSVKALHTAITDATGGSP